MRAVLIAAAAAASVAAGSANAFTVGVDFTVDGTVSDGFNVPRLSVFNASDAGVRLTAFTLTIGNTAFGFDEVYDFGDAASLQPTAPAGGTWTLTAGSTSQGAPRPDDFAIAFTDLDPGESSSWFADLDSDGANDLVDFRNILFDNGAGTPNAAFVATFSGVGVDPFELAYTLPDTGILSGRSSDDSIFTYEARASVNEIPVPAAAALLPLGLAAFAGLRRRRRR